MPKTMTSDKRIWAIIPASGIGHRMQSDRPKQYLSFCHKTVIEHTLDRLLACDQVCGVILVLRADDEYWEKLQYTADKPLFIAQGGAERQDSVINGLNKLHEIESEPCYAMVHDAARPLVKPDDLSALIEALDQNENGAILAVPIADTLKRADRSGCITETVDRNGLWRAFTPQLFESTLLLKALKQARSNSQQMTDDAAAMEAMGYQPQLVECSPQNIKITQPADLLLAEQIWLSRQKTND
jgi:2-C-methyl-D-erythritol 4-phosphate cytidylyltransferase